MATRLKYDYYAPTQRENMKAAVVVETELAKVKAARVFRFEKLYHRSERPSSSDKSSDSVPETKRQMLKMKRITTGTTFKDEDAVSSEPPVPNTDHKNMSTKDVYGHGEAGGEKKAERWRRTNLASERVGALKSYGQCCRRCCAVQQPTS